MFDLREKKKNAGKVKKKHSDDSDSDDPEKDKAKQDRDQFDEILGRYRTKGKSTYRAPDKPVKFRF